MGNSNKSGSQRVVPEPLFQENEQNEVEEQILPSEVAPPAEVAKKVVPEWTWQIIGTMDFMELPAEVIDLIFSFMPANQLGKYLTSKI